VDDLKFLRKNATRPVKFTVPGPFTMTQQAQNDFYASDAEAAQAYATAVNEEIRDLFAAGADVVQLDEPYMQARPDKARAYGLDALNRALDGISGKTCVHICFGYAALIHERPEGYSFLPELANACCRQVSIETGQSRLDCSVLESLIDKEILLGVLDLSTNAVESVETIKERVRRALQFVDPERILLAPDCGMKYLSREAAFGKLSAMVEAARQLRAEV
jgi:5-methyltetrahydropteroyltriglutamate--homocysteine methyltransferase